MLWQIGKSAQLGRSVKPENIQPGLQWPEAEGKISGELDTSGALTEQGGWQVEVSRLAIKGYYVIIRLKC